MDDIKYLLDHELQQKDQPNEKSDYTTSRLKAYYYVFDAHSPYAEVRASVPNTDDPNMPVDTFRAWFIGLSLVFIFACLNQVCPLLRFV